MDAKFYQQMAISHFWAVAIVAPTFHLDVMLKVPQKGVLVFQRNRHIILNCIKASEDQIENCNWQEQFWMQL